MKLYSEETLQPQFVQFSIPDPCGDFEDRKFTVGMIVGEIKLEYKCSGFDSGIAYDSTLIAFNSLLTANTIMEFFDNDYTRAFAEFNIISVDGGTDKGNVSGNRPLFALSLIDKGDLNNDLYLEYLYLNFADGFTPKLEKIVPLFKIERKIQNKPERNIKLNVETNIKIDTTNTQLIEVSLQNNIKGLSQFDFAIRKLENIDFEIVNLADGLMLNKINNDSLVLFNISNLEELNTTKLFDLLLSQKNVDSLITYNTELMISNWNNNSCVTGVLNKEISIETNKIVSSIENDQTFEDEKYIYLKYIDEIEVYDLKGKIIDSYIDNKINKIKYEGIHFIRTKKNSLKKNIIIN